MIIGSRYKQRKVVKLNDVTANGSWWGVDQVVSNAGLRYKPMEVIQLPSLLTMWGALGKIKRNRGIL